MRGVHRHALVKMFWGQITLYYTLLHPQVMVDLFDEQPEIKNHDDFWQFMEGQLLDGLYWEYWYNDGDDK